MNFPELVSIIQQAAVPTPCLVVDRDALVRNVRRMEEFLAEQPAALRPHAKTHKCPEIARLQLEAGATGITCAKLGEAETMAEAGIPDILIANQVMSPGKLSRLARLASSCRMTVAADDPTNLRELSFHVREAGSRIGVLVEVDIGMGRCGVPPGGRALELAKLAADLPGIEFRGLMGYEGHSVFIQEREERRSRCLEALRLLLETRDLLEDSGLPVGVVSAGGTGTFDITGSLPGVTEIQAGSYIFMDARYRTVTQFFEPSLSLVSTVISRPAPDRIVIDAGLKAVSTEFGLPVAVFPEIPRLLRLAEEHGILRLEDGPPSPPPTPIGSPASAPVPKEHCYTPPAAIRPGDLCVLLPSHCCTTVNLHSKYIVVQNGQIADIWPIAARGRFD